MGLDATAFKKLAPIAENVYDEDQHLHIWDGQIAFTENNWPGRSEGVVAGFYSYEDSEWAFNGPYSYYNRFRSWLAIAAGYESDEWVWQNLPADSTGPFVALINFADNEGVIGPVACAKLARDFAEHEERIAKLALSHDEGADFMRIYRTWRRAFELAADGGCVLFH